MSLRAYTPFNLLILDATPSSTARYQVQAYQRLRAEQTKTALRPKTDPMLAPGRSNPSKYLSLTRAAGHAASAHDEPLVLLSSGHNN